MRLTFTALVALLLGSAAVAQYGYYDAYGNPIAYPADYYDMYGNPYPPPYTGGYGFGGPDPIAQQMAALQQQVDAQLLQAMRPFIDYYRQATGDQQTPDELAGQYGMDLWCKDHPVECERAQAQSAQDSAWLAQSNAAFQQRMAQQQAGFDAYMQGIQGVAAANDASFDSWMAGQNSSYESHQDWVQGAIYGEGDYTDPNTGATLSLPYAPDPNWAYQSPAGNPLWHDSTTNTWYEVDPYGFYTPYYGQ